MTKGTIIRARTIITIMVMQTLGVAMEIELHIECMYNFIHRQILNDK